MALTATELTRLRHLTGGVVATTAPDHLSDTELQAEYTDAGDDFDNTIIPVIRLRLGMAAVYVNGAPEFGIEQYESRFQHLQRLLTYYEGLFGESGTLIQTGEIDTGIDYEATS